MTARLPIGVCLGSVGATAGWWLESARRLDEAGYAGLWCWDHFMGKGALDVPVVEQWTILAAASAVAPRATLGTFVTNVMNRHPAVVARMATTLHAASGGRLILGIGIGGHPAEHTAYGIAFPPPAERAERLEEAVAVIRALWSGELVTRPSRWYPLAAAVARPVVSPPPRIIVGGESAAGASLAGRIGDGWTAFAETFERDLPRYLAALEERGADRAGQLAFVAFQAGRSGEDALRGSPWIAAPSDTLARWRAAGADGAIVTARTPADVDALVDAAGRW